MHRERCGTGRRNCRTETETTDKDYRAVTGRRTGQAASHISSLHQRAAGWKSHCCRAALRSWRGGTGTERGNGRHLHRPGIRVIRPGAGGWQIRCSIYRIYSIYLHSENMACYVGAGVARPQQHKAEREGLASSQREKRRLQYVRSVGRLVGQAVRVVGNDAQQQKSAIQSAWIAGWGRQRRYSGFSSARYKKDVPLVVATSYATIGDDCFPNTAWVRKQQRTRVGVGLL